jgi:fibronectin-binding autotransporter adhesin
MTVMGFRFTLSLLLAVILGVSSAHAQRQMEKLGRGVVVLRTSSTQTYIGWRLLGNDPQDLAFNLYRSANGATAVKVNTSPLTATTDYVDTPGSLTTTAYTYSVRPVLNNVEVTDSWANLASGPVTLPVNAPIRQYIPVPIQPTPDDASAGVSYGVKFCWVGDFDGDGEYDFVIDRTNPNVEAKQWLQAYKRDGTLLWQMDMGPNSVDHYNITPGSSAVGIGHGDNVTVYDLDGDGKAEVIVRTANGVVFANGTTLSAPDNETQYISIIDGQTGVEKARTKINLPAGWPTQTHVNGQMGIVYADGMRPSLFFHPSNRNPDQSFNKCAITWDYRGGVLSQRWIWLESGHTAEGHQIRLSDVNNDGKDEYVDIGNVVKADGSGQINESVLTEIVHGDRFHVADIDPDRPGLETYLIQQNNGTGLATVYHSADKSAVIKKLYASDIIDVGRGTIGAFVPALPGLQMFSTFGGTYDAKGNQIYSSAPFPPETIWWDGDLGREFLSTIGSSATSPGIDKFNTTDGSTSRVLSIYSDSAAPGSPYNNYIAYGGRPQFWGDILGDWREELLCVATDNSELRIYTTKTADIAKTSGGSPLRIYTLMHNPQYRIQATTKGYVQSSYVDYYLGYGMTPPPPPPMVDAKLVWRGGTGTTTWDSGSTQSWLNATANSTFANGDTVRFDISGNNTTSVTLTGTLQPGTVTVYSPTDYTFSGTGSLSGTMPLVKAGAGALTLAGTHTFTGATTVWDGALVVNGSLQSSPVTVWGGTWGGALASGQTGGRLAGTGTFGQPVTVRYRGAITPGTGMNNAGTLTFAGGLAAEDKSTFALDLSDDPAGTVRPSDRIAVTGNLTLTGTVSIVVNPLNGTLAAGTYTLATYTGTLTGSLANLSVILPAGTPYTLAVGSGSIRLTVPVTRAAAAVTWRGSGANWDLAATQNWLRAGSPDVFVSGDSVTFDSTGSATPAVTLTTALPTAGVTVNSPTDYTFTGAGSIAGSGGLTKSGTGTLTVNTANTYTGPTVINGGVLAVSALGDADSPSTLGASSDAATNLVLNGGTLRLTGLQTNMNRKATLGASGGTFDITLSNSSIQASGVISGSGSLTKTGDGTLLLATANTYTGGTVINAGKIYLAGSTANKNGLGSGSVTINNGTLAMADVQNNDVAAWNLVVPSGATARLDADGRCSLTGSLTGGGDLTVLTPYIRTDFKGNWSAFTGRVYMITDGDGGDYRLWSSAGLPAAELNLSASVYAVYQNTLSSNLTLPLGALSGEAGSTLAGTITSGRTLTWQIGARGNDTTFAGTIKNSTGTTALEKVGTGTLTLSGASTYTGATAVNAGELVLSGGSLTGTNVTVASGAGFGGNGSVTGNVTFASGSTLLADPSAGPLAITGNLTLNGTLTVSPVPGASLPPGTYPLYTYTGTLIGTPSFIWAGVGIGATFDTSVAGVVSITLTRIPSNLTWTGSASSTWNTSAVNWTFSGGSTFFVNDDTVRFDDTSTVTTVTLSGSLSPASITVDSAQAYAFSGTGALAGSGSLSKSGSGTLTFSTAQTYSGGTTVTAGTLALNTGGSLAGSITLSNDVVFRMAANGTSIFPGNPLTLSSGATATLSSANLGNGYSGAVTGPSDAALTLSGPVSFSASGSAQLGSFNGTLTIPSGSQLRFSSTSGANGNGGSSTAFVVNGTLNSRNASGAGGIVLGSLSGSGSLQGQSNTTAGSTTFFVGARGGDTTFSGTIINTTNGTVHLTKQGSGSLTLSGVNTYTGATTISNGQLLITGSLGTTAVSVANTAAFGGTGTLGGNLTLASGATLAFGVTPSFTRGITVSGSSTLNGTIYVSPVLFGASLVPGTYTILTYTGSLGGSPSFSWSDSTGSGLLATFSTATANQVRVTLITPLQSWRQSHFGSTSPAADTLDTDNDGLPNLLEYALGSNPTNPSSAPILSSQLSANSSQLQLAFTRVADPYLTYTVQGSSDLVTWSDLWSSTNAAGPVTVTDTVPAAPRRFLRLKVSTTSP